jgi:hypothetical protein
MQVAPGTAQGVIIRAVDIAKIRTGLNEARAVIGVPPIAVISLAVGTVIKSEHIQEVRQGSK